MDILAYSGDSFSHASIVVLKSSIDLKGLSPSDDTISASALSLVLVSTSLSDVESTMCFLLKDCFHA